MGSLVDRKIGYGIVQPGQNILHGVPVIKVNNLIAGLHSKGELDVTTKENDEKYSRTRLEGGELIVSVVGTVGKTAIVPKSFRGCNLVRAVAMIDIKENWLSRWVKYYIDSPAGQAYIEQNLNTTVQATLNIKTLVDMPIPFLKEDEMRKIVTILEAIDKKIECNQQINDNLSDLLQTIYQGQFGKVGLANNCGILADICSYSKDKIEISKLSLDTYYSTENMLPEKSGAVKATSLPTTSQTTACHKGDTLISNIRPYFKKIVYCEDDCGCSTDVLCFKPVHPRYTAYLFSTLYADSFFDFMVAGAKGTKMPRGDKQQIMTYPVVLPSEKDLSEFNSVATPILTQIYSNRTESERLSAIRDTLLPKLILGEIDVSSIQL